MAQTSPDPKFKFLNRRRWLAECAFLQDCAECNVRIIDEARKVLRYKDRTMNADILRALRRVWDRMNKKRGAT